LAAVTKAAPLPQVIIKPVSAYKGENTTRPTPPVPKVQPQGSEFTNVANFPAAWNGLFGPHVSQLPITNLPFSPQAGSGGRVFPEVHPPSVLGVCVELAWCMALAQCQGTPPSGWPLPPTARNLKIRGRAFLQRRGMTRIKPRNLVPKASANSSASNDVSSSITALPAYIKMTTLSSILPFQSLSKSFVSAAAAARSANTAGTIFILPSKVIYIERSVQFFHARNG